MYKKTNYLVRKQMFALAFMLILLCIASIDQRYSLSMWRVFSFEALFDCSNILMKMLAVCH